ncbi:MAG TPA: hypothetical protein VFS20_14280 [Longimicrobium sp.]|nr:hypothetical protein [Longimicrobium sp.]
MLMLLVMLEVDGYTGRLARLAMGLRGAGVLLLSMGLITTEALWKARPAAYPASLALAVSWFVAVPAVAAMAAVAEPVFLQRAALLLGASAVGVIPMLLYIRHRSRQLVAAGGRPHAHHPAVRER